MKKWMTVVAIMATLASCGTGGKKNAENAAEQDTVDGKTLEAVRLSSGGRHDPCIVHRALIVQESVTALVLFDALTARFGTDWFGGK